MQVLNNCWKKNFCKQSAGMVRKLISVVFVFLMLSSSAQKTLLYTDNEAQYKLGVELFQKEKFGAAQKAFSSVIETHIDRNSLIRIDAEYYNAICAIELFNKDGEWLLKNFINEHPENPKVKTAYFYLGKSNYRKKKYKEALDWFAKVDVYDLSNEELAEFYFKRGYCSFINEKYAEAKKDFYEIKDVDNKYALSAKYYYAHIAYYEKNYETALKEFLKLQKNETFGAVVPFYIAQIYYLQGKYNEVITYAPALLDSLNNKRSPEIARILGDSYFRTSRYNEAITYLKKFEKFAGALTRADNYQMGYAYYQTKNYSDAINYFEKISNASDSLFQNAAYHLGDCYLKTDKKQNALSAFGEAYKLSFDKVITEDALWNYAKLAYDLSYNPYNDAIRAFQKYINDYPNSTRIDDAYSFLVNVFITTKSYKEALESIEKIKILTPELKQAYQKVAYYRGVDLFNNGEYADAIKLFDKSTKYKYDKNINVMLLYWKAEAHYRSKQYDKAIETYMDFMDEPGAVQKKEWNDVNYNLGYAYLKLNDYNNSVMWFRKFITFKPSAEAKKINDALNRIGDAYFMARDFSNAVDFYAQSYRMKLLNADYALFQKALANGVQKKHKDKIADLKLFIATYSTTSSVYNQKARFELAYAYLQDEQNEMALNAFKKFLDDYPNSIYENAALSKIGLIYYNQHQDENALVYFDKLIKRDKKSSDAHEAIEIVKKIYSAKGNVEGLESWLASIGATIPQASLDSITYNIGRTHYLEQDCKTAITDFEKYITKFADGIFILESNFYKAECEYRQANYEQALLGYKYIIGKNKSVFTEQSLSRAADLVYKKQDYLPAIDYYKQLEAIAENQKNNALAKIGLMRCYSNTKAYNEAIDYANKVLGLEKIAIELSSEAHFTIAQANFANNKLDEALSDYTAVAANAKNEMGAEAKYQIAFINNQKKEYKKSEKNIFDFINGDGDYPYWVTKALILLADNYVALNDLFQAKTTLKSVIEDADNSELKKIAEDNLAKIIANEEEAKKPKKPEDPIKIKFENNSEKQNELFNNGEVKDEDKKPENEN